MEVSKNIHSNIHLEIDLKALQIVDCYLTYRLFCGYWVCKFYIHTYMRVCVHDVHEHAHKTAAHGTSTKEKARSMAFSLFFFENETC